MVTAAKVVSGKTANAAATKKHKKDLRTEPFLYFK
jgi:hypothetical protein